MLKIVHRILMGIFIGAIAGLTSVEGQIAPTNSATISGSIVTSNGIPAAGVQLVLEGPKHAQTQTDKSGLFVFVGVPFGTYTLSAVDDKLGTVMRTINVQGDMNVAIHYQNTSTTLKQIAHVSSSANAQFNVTSASVTAVNPAKNAFMGKTSWRTILEQIPGVAQAGLGSGNVGFAAFPDGPFVPVKVSIDGGLPYETSTLLDNMPLIAVSAGNRFAGAGSDLSLYPLNAFDGADVVRGPGASAPSIVNSIGGSFILHTPGSVAKQSYELSVSNDPYGGIVMNSRVALPIGKLSITGSYGINDSPGPIQASGIPATLTVPIFAIDGHAFAAYSAPCPPPGCLYGSYLINSHYATAILPIYGYQRGLLVCCYPQSAAWSQHSGSLTLNYAFSPRVSAKVFYTFQQSVMANCPLPNLTDTFTPPSGYAGSVPAGQLVLSELGYSLTSTADPQASSLLEEQLNVQLGQGVVHLAALQNRTFWQYTPSSPASATLHLYGGGTLDGTTNVVYNGSVHTVTLGQIICNEEEQANNRDLLLSYQTPIGQNYHAGLSFVQSYMNNPLNYSYDFYGFTGGSVTPSGISQTNREWRFFVGGNLSEKTSLDLSMYFVNPQYHVPAPGTASSTPGADIPYTDVNSHFAAPRLGFVWRPTAAVAMRASAGGGLAVAAANDLIGTPAANYGTFYQETVPNLNIEPEKSFAFDLGTDIRLPRSTVVSLDLYEATLTGQLFQATSLGGTHLGLPLYLTQYQNLGTSRYAGILLDVRHDTPRGIYWRLSGGLTRGYVVSVPPGFYNAANATCNFSSGIGCQNVNVVPGINFNGTLNVGPGGYAAGASVPYAQGLGILGYRWNPGKQMDITATYYGNNNSYFRPAFVEIDGNLEYALNKNISLLVNFRNITGIYGSPVQVQSINNFMGAPTIVGLPYPEMGEEYGPRTIVLTTLVHL